MFHAFFSKLRSSVRAAFEWSAWGLRGADREAEAGAIEEHQVRRLRAQGPDLRDPRQCHVENLAGMHCIAS